MKKMVLSLTAVVILFCCVTQARATVINNSNGLLQYFPQDKVSTITFAEHFLSAGTPLAANFADLGVTFSGLYYFSSSVSLPNQSSPLAVNFSSPGGPTDNLFSINFNGPQPAVAFSLATLNSQNVFFKVFLGGQVVGDSGWISGGSTGSSNTKNYYVFKDITFDQIQVYFPDLFNLNGPIIMAAIDNIQLDPPSTVPEPYTLLFLGSCLTPISLVGFAGKFKN
jgi:hypothetical protein